MARPHGLKATALSWCAKYGVDESTRMALGHHKQKHKSTLVALFEGFNGRPIETVGSCSDGHS
eukprot:4293443-Amphidinium_carterae.1